MRVRDCAGCNGTGIDETDWLGECAYCDGDGTIDEDDDLEPYDGQLRLDDEGEQP